MAQPLGSGALWYELFWDYFNFKKILLGGGYLNSHKSPSFTALRRSVVSGIIGIYALQKHIVLDLDDEALMEATQQYMAHYFTVSTNEKESRFQLQNKTSQLVSISPRVNREDSWAKILDTPSWDL